MDKDVEAQVAHAIDRAVNYLGPEVAGGICIGMGVLTLLSFCMMFKKAGYSFFLGFLLLVPFLGPIMIFWLGFAPWPALKKRKPWRSS